MIKKFKQMKEWFKREILLSEIQANTKASKERREKEEKEELKDLRKKEVDLFKLQIENDELKQQLESKDSQITDFLEKENDLFKLQNKNDELKEQLKSKDTQITDLLEKIKELEGKERLLENPLVQEMLKETFKEYTSEKIVLEKVEDYSEEFENGDSERGIIKTTETYNLPGKFKKKVILKKGELTCADGHNTGIYRYDTYSLETEKYNEKGDLTYSSYNDHLDRSSEKFYKNGTLEREVEKEGESPSFDKYEEVQYVDSEIQSSLRYEKGWFREEFIREGNDLHRTFLEKDDNAQLYVTKGKGGEVISRKTYDVKAKNIDLTKPVDLSKYQEVTVEKDQPKEKPKIFIPKYKGKDNEMER